MSGRSYRFILSSRWMRYIVLALAAAVACGFLANWQNNRREQRDAEIAHINANYGATPVDLQTLLPRTDAGLSAADDWKRVTATGSYDTEHTILVRNRSLDGQAGFYVLVPLRTDAGQVAVIRGWVPTEDAGDAPSLSSLPAPPAGQVTITGWVRPAQDGDGETAAGGSIRAIDPTVVPGMDQPFTGVYLQLQSEDPPPQQALTALPRPSTDPGSHLSYTFQWIVFGIMILGGLVYAARRERVTRELAAAEDEGQGAQPEYVVVDKAALAAGRKAGRGASPVGRSSRYGTAGTSRAPVSSRYGGNRPTRGADVPAARPGRKRPSPVASRKISASRSDSAEAAEDAQLDEQGF